MNSRWLPPMLSSWSGGWGCRYLLPCAYDFYFWFVASFFLAPFLVGIGLWLLPIFYLLQLFIWLGWVGCLLLTFLSCIGF